MVDLSVITDVHIMIAEVVDAENVLALIGIAADISENIWISTIFNKMDVAIFIKDTLLAFGYQVARVVEH